MNWQPQRWKSCTFSVRNYYKSWNMVWSNEINNVLLLLWSYAFIYNLSLFALFGTLFQILNSNFKTLYSFSSLGHSNIFTKVLLVSLFSMAGVPPFWGFFSKLFILLLLCNSTFFLLFAFLFVLLFVGLYFYMQNIRFLNMVGPVTTPYASELNTRLAPLYFYWIYPTIFFLIFGFFFTEDLFLMFSWVLY